MMGMVLKVNDDDDDGEDDDGDDDDDDGGGDDDDKNQWNVQWLYVNFCIWGCYKL